MIWRKRRSVRVFMDVDGVLAPTGANQPDVCSVNVGGWYGNVLYVPKVVDKLKILHTKKIINICWLTSWENDANTIFSPAVGLDQYHVFEEPVTPVSRLYWKEQVVRDYADRNPRFVWVDDEMVLTGSGESVRNDFPGSLIIAPLSHVGLTENHVAMIENYVSNQKVTD